MRAVEFAGQTDVIAKDQPEYLPLPAQIEGDIVTTCWRPTLRERLSVLLFGRVWLRQMTFQRPLQPIVMLGRRQIPEGRA